MCNKCQDGSTLYYFLFFVFIFEDEIKARQFFEPIINNLNHLQVHGLVVNGIRLSFSFSTLVADNLAAHFIGGFQTHFNSGHFCRKCDITYENKNLPMSSLNIKSRTMTNHDDVVAKIMNDPNRTPLMGVIGPSLLEDLIGFHPTTSLPFDVMHDFLEGACPIVLLCLLKQASSLRLLTYSKNILFYPLLLDPNALNLLTGFFVLN